MHAGLMLTWISICWLKLSNFQALVTRLVQFGWTHVAILVNVQQVYVMPYSCVQKCRANTYNRYRTNFQLCITFMKDNGKELCYFSVDFGLSLSYTIAHTFSDYFLSLVGKENEPSFSFHLYYLFHFFPSSWFCCNKWHKWVIFLS